MYFSLFLLKLNSSSLAAHNHEQLERAHSICLASHQSIIAAIEFPLAAHELLCSPHIFIRVTKVLFGSAVEVNLMLKERFAVPGMMTSSLPKFGNLTSSI